MMRVLMTIAAVDLHSGGPSKSATDLASFLSSEANQVTLYALDRGHELLVYPKDKLSYDLQLYKTSGLPLDRRRVLRSMADNMKKATANSHNTVIHNHGIWLGVNRMAAQVARETERPFVISTRGMLEPWALNYRKRKKQLAWWLYQKRDLQTAKVLHATALQEAENLRRLGLKQPIAVIPNGVTVPSANKVSDPDKRLRTVLFLSRVHPKKGLLNLVDAWNIIRPEGWRVQIAGPEENGHRKEVEKRIRRARLDGQFEFVGPIYDDRKWDLYSSSDIFVLPTFSENFGIVVAEALASAIPVITTKGAPWKDLVTHNCGWWIDIGVEPLTSALRKAIAISDSERSAMGLRGKELIRRSYSWDKIASEMLATYEWILGGGTPPSCVLTD